ncbi:MAG TPA: hypothetical protein PKV80_03625 [Leptospiraceae bacterium]|nr:hypothetical protein [Leptospiraceae bacterium]HNO23519.1 hypothetical protein [Leptospiraceae bacterium]
MDLNLPFLKVWWSVSLKYRKCSDTYGGFPYDTLPPLNKALFKGDFGWLDHMDDDLKRKLSVYRRPEAEERIKKNLSKIQRMAEELGISLPEEFVKFMSSEEMRLQIPSCTACYFDLPEKTVRLPIKNGGYAVRFLNDQQEIFLWYLYISPDSKTSIIVSSIMFDEENLDEIPEDVLISNIHYSAPSFEEFLYRFWLENSIWYALDEKKKLTPSQEEYLNHYKKMEKK